jgi:hypothetical protein
VDGTNHFGVSDDVWSVSGSTNLILVTLLSRSCWQYFESADIAECVFGLVRMKANGQAEQGKISKRHGRV